MNKLSYFKIGLFVISATVLAVIGIIVLGVGSVFQRTALVETYIEESVQGLDIGSPMKFRGVLVGKVEEITLTSAVYDTKRRYVLVRIGITSNLFQFPLADPNDPSFKSELDRGFRVRLASQGLTGVAYLEADYLDPERNPPLEIDWQPKYPYIPSARSRIVQLSDSVESILQNFEQLDIPRLVNSVDKSLTAITRMAEGANVEKIGAQANALLTEVRETNRQLKDLSRQSGAQIDTRRCRRNRGQRAPDHRARGKALEPNAGRSAASLGKSGAVGETARFRFGGSAGHERSAPPDRSTAEPLDLQPATGHRKDCGQPTLDIGESERAHGRFQKYPSQLLFGGPPPPSKVMQR